MLSLQYLLSSLLGSSSTENWWKICCRDQTRKITQACFNQLAAFADILSIAAIFILQQGHGEQIIHTGCFLHRLQRIVHLVQSMLLSIFVYRIVCLFVHFGLRAPDSRGWKCLSSQYCLYVFVYLFVSLFVFVYLFVLFNCLYLFDYLFVLELCTCLQGLDILSLSILPDCRKGLAE